LFFFYFSIIFFLEKVKVLYAHVILLIESISNQT